MAEPATDFTLDTAQVLAEEEHGASIVGRSPWYLAWRRLRRNYIAFIALFVFVVIAVACSLAPIYAHHIAHTAPNATHTEDIVNGKQVLSAPVIGTDAQGNVVVEKAGGVLGPTWWHAHGRFVLGADGLGRDVAVRLLYGGLNSLKIGIGSALICVMVAVLLALLAGFYGGWVDWIITRSFDLIWAFPVLLLAIALGSALSINGFHHFGISISPHSLWIPTLVISYVYVPYVGRPLRGQILSLREKEFIEAAIGQGASPLRIMFSDLLPNIMSSVLVFFTLIIANNIVLEAALSFLGAGVQDPTPSWGKLISQGQELIVTRPVLALAPGIAIIVTVLSLNIFGDGLRDALDPRAKVRVEH